MSRASLSSLSTYVSVSTSRLQALYSDFSRQKHSNPTSYASNIEWWRRTLEETVFKGSQSQPTNTDRLILHVVGTSLAENFRYEGVGKPLSLPTVVAELCSNKSYYPLNQFLIAPQSIYDPGWLPYRIASYVIGKPLWWALQQLNLVSLDDSSSSERESDRWKHIQGDYVVLSLLELAADNVLDRLRQKVGVTLADSLYTFESFRREFASVALDGTVLSERDMKVLVRFLERDKRVLVVQKDIIKFVGTEGVELREITVVDSGVLELKTAVENLQAQLDRIQHQIDERTAKASTALRQKHKDIALSHLRSRKQLEDLLRKRLSSMETLHSTLIRVEASAGDIEIMKSYETSATTLRALLAHPSLQRDQIEETMEAMASANADAREVDDTIRIGIELSQGNVEVDDAELEAELSALVRETQAEEATKEERAIQQRLASGLLQAPRDIPGNQKTDEGNIVELTADPIV